MEVDAPGRDATVQQPFVIRGWAIDRTAAQGTGVDAVHVYAYPADANGAKTGGSIWLGGAEYGRSRLDVGRVYGEQFTDSGYIHTASGLAPGYHLLVVYARSKITGAWQDSQRVFRVP
jgi:hypothetical protein